MPLLRPLRRTRRPMTDSTPAPIGAAIVGAGVGSDWPQRARRRRATARRASSSASPASGWKPAPTTAASSTPASIYPRDSLKADLCVEGRERLYAFCEEHGVPCVRCGKLIVAAEADEIGALETLAARGHANGVTDRLRTSCGRGPPPRVRSLRRRRRRSSGRSSHA